MGHVPPPPPPKEYPPDFVPTLRIDDYGYGDYGFHWPPLWHIVVIFWTEFGFFVLAQVLIASAQRGAF